MSTTESPLTDILAQLRERTEVWAHASATARASLAQEVARARHSLESNEPDTATIEAAAAQEAAQAEQAATHAAALAEAQARADQLAAQVEFATAQAHANAQDHAAAQARLQAAEQEIAELRNALEQTKSEAATLMHSAGDKVDISELVALREGMAQLKALHAEVLAQRDKAIDAHAGELAATRADLARLSDDAGRAAATRALLTQGIPAFDDHGHRRRMGTILVEAGVLNEEELSTALAEQAANPQRRLGTIVVDRGYTNEELVARILAAQLRLSFVALEPGSYDRDAATRISAHLARLHKAIPIAVDGDSMTVAMANPLDLIAIEDMEIASRLRVEPVVATRTAIDVLLAGLS